MINVAVIGTGNMGKYHARVYSEMDTCNLVAVADINKETGQRIAEIHGCKYYEDFKDMLEKEDIDAVSIVVPTKLHKKVALACMDKVKAILIEKPITVTMEEAEEVIKRADEMNVKLMVGHIERFNPAVGKLREIVDSGELGDIISITSKRVGLFPPQMNDSNVIIDLAVHDIDVCGFILKKSPQEIFSVSGRAINSIREDYADIFIKYKDNPSLFIQVNWLTPVKIRMLYITGTKGYAELNYMTQELVLYKGNYKNNGSSFEDFVKSTTPEKIIIPIEKKEPLKEEIKSFISCVNGSTCLSSGRDGLEALKIALKAMESYKNNKVITF